MSVILFTVACLAGIAVGSLVSTPAGGLGLPVFWPPAGVLLAMLATSERRRWLRWVVITFAACLLAATTLAGKTLLVSAGLAALICVDAAAAAWLLQHWWLQRYPDGRFTLTRVLDVSLLILIATTIPALTAVVAGGLLMGDSFWLAWRGWWLAETLGILLVAPLAFGVIEEWKDYGPALRSGRAIEALIAFGGLGMVSVAVFSGFVDPLLRVPAYVLPFLLWPAIRMGPAGSAVAVIIACLTSVWNTAHGRGPFVFSEPLETLLLRSQGAMAMVAVTFVLLSSIVAERRNALRDRARLVTDLQQALAEIKTLRGFIPICAWCHNVRDDDGFWQRLEIYLGDNTDATFSHSICPACTEKQNLLGDKEPSQEWKI
jgi:integral membrane sensor domain MASE1